MVTLRAAGVTAVVDGRGSCLRSLRLGRAGVEMTPRPPAGLLEVADLRAGTTYHPLHAPFSIRGWKRSSAGGQTSVSFVQQYRGAPFEIVQTFRETPAGIRWEAAIRLRAGEKANRTLRVSWVLPMPGGWAFWSPQDTAVQRNDGMAPRRYVYGHISFRPWGTAIPLVGVWGERAGLAAFSPPDIQKPYITFDLHTQDVPAPVRGIEHGFEDLADLRVAHHMVGLRPGKELRLAVCLAAIRPDWRCALGHYADSYPELFEPIPATRKVEGMYGITNPSRLAAGELRRLKTAGVTFAEVHGHFPEYSVYMSRQALADPRRTWRCRPHPGKQLSLADNRRWIDRLLKAGIAPFMYYYNCHALPDTIARLWPGSTMRDERGKPLLKWYTEPSIYGPPESPYGRHLIEQMELLLEAYPDTPGFFVDNYAIEMLDFAHDDGVTMVHDRPAYDLNQNHIRVGPIAFEKAHAAGKIIMVNKVSTIESLRGADMVLAETRGVEAMRNHALACVYRPLFPLAMELPPGPNPVERGIQHLLVLGCTPDDRLYRQDARTMRAYRPLTDAMIGRRWVLQFDPLTISRQAQARKPRAGAGPPAAGAGSPSADVPEGVEAQVFRIDRHAPRGGDVVVAIVDFRGSWKEKRSTPGLTVTLRLPEAARLRSANWLAVERSSGKGVLCRMRRKGRTITVDLPPLGAAGILRLTR